MTLKNRKDMAKKDYEQMTQAPGRLHSIASGNILAGADEILDDNFEMRQSDINEQVFGDAPTSMKKRLESIDAAFQVNGEDAVITTDPSDVKTGGGKIPTTNAVAGAIKAAKVAYVAQSEPRVTIAPNALNVWPQPMSSLEITLGTGAAGLMNEYLIQFTCPTSGGTSLSFTDEIAWANDDEIEPEPGYTYQISIVNGLAVYAGWEAASV